MPILTVNGIGSHHGSGSTDLAQAELTRRGIHAIDVNYKAISWWQTRWEFARVRVATAIEEAAATLPASAPIDVLAHSFGCLGTIQAMRRGLELRHVWFFGAAVDRDIDLRGLRFRSLTNVCNKSDLALQSANIFRFGHPMGKLGRDGYSGPSDPRIENSFWSGYDQEGADDDWKDHSDYFRGEHLNAWMDRVQAQQDFARD